MVRSMTGYGKAVCELADKKVTIEIRSLNSKQLDLNLRVPSYFREKEQEVRTISSKQLERGKADVQLYLEFNGEKGAASINKELALAYHAQLKELSELLNTQLHNEISTLVKFPDVLKSEKVEVNEQEWEEVQKTLFAALNDFNKFRVREGNELKADFIKRINLINEYLLSVEKVDPIRMEKVRAKLKASVNEIAGNHSVDENRFEQELIYYAEKLDITEEKVRLKTHLDYFIQTLNESSSGRKLGFITQEIGREINTIGSKANDADIQKNVVMMKDELEKIKEQVNNIL